MKYILMMTGLKVYLLMGCSRSSREFLGGYWIINVERPEPAYKIASALRRHPGPEHNQRA